MFGRPNILKALQKTVNLLWQENDRTVRELGIYEKEIKNHIKSVQSTNDKRYNEIKKSLDLSDKSIATLLTEMNIRKMDTRPTLEQTVTCDTCKCLLYEKDAIKGESRIVKSNDGAVWLNGKYYDDYACTIEHKDEEIETPYYCHKCGGKSEKSGNKKTRSTVVKTNKK